MPLDLKAAIMNRLSQQSAGNNPLARGGSSGLSSPMGLPTGGGMGAPLPPPPLPLGMMPIPDVGSMPQGPKTQGNPMDPRGLAGIMSRGSNVYSGGLPQAQMGGGPQFGRPTTNGASKGAIGRRIGAR